MTDREILDAAITDFMTAIRNDDETLGPQSVATLAALGLRQLIRIADAAEKLAGVMDQLPPHKPEPDAPDENPAPYSRVECVHASCPLPNACRGQDACVMPTGWGKPPTS